MLFGRRTLDNTLFPPPPPSFLDIVRIFSVELDLIDSAQIRLWGVGARSERRVIWTCSTTVCHCQTVCKRSSATLPNVCWNGNNTVRTLGLWRAVGEDRICEWKLEVFHVGLTCHALWNGVESVHHRHIGRSPTTRAILAGIIPGARRRWRSISCVSIWSSSFVKMRVNGILRLWFFGSTPFVCSASKASWMDWSGQARWSVVAAWNRQYDSPGIVSWG